MNGESMTPVMQLTSAFQDVYLYMTEVSDREVSAVPLADAAEVARFATPKRRQEYLSVRWLLGQCLIRHGIGDLTSLEIQRTEKRAPFLAYIQGVWRRVPLPHISLAHSAGHAFVALSFTSNAVGIDAEPVERELSGNAFDMMAKGDELNWLRMHPNQAMRLWTGKEAVQKALQEGMHLNPRDIEIPIEYSDDNISIVKSNIQLKYWIENAYHLSLATTPSPPAKESAEDLLLEETRMAMLKNPQWGVGCQTQRNNA